MLPSQVLGRLDFIPAEIGLGLAIGLFDEGALAFALGQNGQWGIFGRIAEAEGI